MDENYKKDAFLKKVKENVPGILYSTEVAKELEETNKKEFPRIAIIAKNIKDENNNKETVLAYVYKYREAFCDFDIILGLLHQKSIDKEMMENIENLLRDQLKLNVNKDSDFISYENLVKYINEKDIPFEFTLEGLDILSTKRSNKIIQKTFVDSKDSSELLCLYNKEEIKEKESNMPNIINMKEQVNRHIEEERKRQIEEANKKKLEELELKRQALEMKKEKRRIEEEQAKQKSWMFRRTKILDTFTSLQKESFFKGERIAHLMEKCDTDVSTKKNIVEDYLFETYLKKEEESTPKDKIKQIILEEYLKIKERYIADIAIKELEQKENVELEKITDNNPITNYKAFFKHIYNGNELAATTVLKFTKVNFDELKQFFEDSNVNEELSEYLRLKENAIYDKDEDKSKSQYILNDFLVHCNVDANTEEYKKIERIVLGVFENVEEEVNKNNEKDIKLYNHYAEKNGIYAWKASINKENSKKQKATSNVIEKIAEGYYTDEIIEIDNEEHDIDM